MRGCTGFWQRRAIAAAPLLLALLPVAVVMVNGPVPPDLRRDIDLVLGGQALLSAGGQIPDFYHYGYLHFLLLGYWYQALHGLGLIPFATLHEVRTLETDATRLVLGSAVLFQAAMAGLGTLFFAGIARRLAPTVAALAGTVLCAASLGFLVNASLIQSEIHAGVMLLGAFYLLLRARDAATDEAAWGFIALAAAAAYLSVMAKGQAFMVASALPVLIVVFGRPARRRVTAFADGRAVAFTLLAATAAIPGWYMIAGSWLSKGGGAYQPLIAAVALSMVALYARLYGGTWRPAPVAAAAAAVFLGVAMGQYVHLVRFDGHYTDATVNILDHLMKYRNAAGQDAPPLASMLVGNLWVLLVDKATGGTLERIGGGDLFYLYPLRLLYLGLPAVIGLLAWRRQWPAAVRVAAPFVLALAGEAAMLARYPSLFHWPFYFVFVECWLLVGLVVALAELRPGPGGRAAVLAAAVIMAGLQVREIPGWARQWRIHQSPSQEEVCFVLKLYNTRLLPYFPSCRGG